jgi:two-component system, cell cycle response regulator
MKILIVEDDTSSAHILEHRLRQWGYEVLIARDGVEGWEQIRADPDLRLAIVDWMLPRMDGLEICRKVRQRGQDPYVYLILLTARSQQEDIITGLDAGADDYLIKPADARELQVRLRAGRRILDLQSELLATRAALLEQATRDSLTRLWNRAMVLNLLDRDLAAAKRRGSPVSLLLVDLDHFKHVNDTLGHRAGDAALREIAQRLQMALRCSDAIGRYGGEEFLIVLADCQSADALMKAEKLCSYIAAQPIDTSEGIISLTVSVGVATTMPLAPLSADILIHAADQALYHAKRAGRNRVAMADLSTLT